MNLIKAALLLSAFVALSVAHDESKSESWDNWLECAHVGARASAKLLRGSIPAIRTLYQCIEYEPIRNSDARWLTALKNIYEFLKRSVYERQSCLLDPLKATAVALKPFVNRIDSLSCIKS